jgi:hypothetical protein
MKHGDKVYTLSWWYRTKKYPPECYLFRYDPVPGIHKRKNCRYYRHFRTTQEMRWSYAYPEYVRGRRRHKNLPTIWDDVAIDRDNKNWKKQNKKEKQWMHHI